MTHMISEKVLNRALCAFLAMIFALAVCGCGQHKNYTDSETSKSEVTEMTKVLKLYIGDKEVPVTWQDNQSVQALKELAAGGLTVQMSMYGGFEQVGSLGADLPRDDRQITADYGDMVLYSGNRIVIFYGSNSWSYTRLGHIELSQQEMTGLLSNEDVTITLKTEGEQI